MVNHCHYDNLVFKEYTRLVSNYNNPYTNVTPHLENPISQGKVLLKSNMHG